LLERDWKQKTSKRKKESLTSLPLTNLPAGEGQIEFTNSSKDHISTFSIKDKFCLGRVLDLQLTARVGQMGSSISIFGAENNLFRLIAMMR
jgi:hypothetical protein